MSVESDPETGDGTDEYEFTLESPGGLSEDVTVEAESRPDALDTLSEWEWYEVGVEDTSGAWTHVTVAAPDLSTAEDRAERKAEGKAFNKIDNGNAYDSSCLGPLAQLNHDYSDGREEWGENFIVRVEVDGTESVGSGVAPRAMDALVEYIGPEESAFDHADRPADPSEISPHAARSAEWYSKGAKFTDAKTRLTLTLAGPEGLLDAEFDALEDRVADALPDLWMQEAVPRGLHENPYDDPYQWWASGGRAFYNGHEFTLTCGQCDAEMDFDSLYGEGHEFNFVCDSDACTTEQERVAGEGTYESKWSVSVCPSSAPPSGWSAFIEGFEASIERDGDVWRIEATDEDGTYTATLESETLAEAVVGDA